MLSVMQGTKQRETAKVLPNVQTAEVLPNVQTAKVLPNVQTVIRKLVNSRCQSCF